MPGGVRRLVARVTGGSGGALPSGLLPSSRLRRGERVLASAALADGTWVAGTDRRLLVVRAVDAARPGHGDGAVAVDLPWSDVDTAAWDDDGGVLSVVRVDGRTSWLQPAEPATAATRRLLELVRERVDATVVATHRVTVAGRGGARLVARRREEGLSLQVLPDRGTDLADPEVAAAVAEGRAVIEDQVGPLP